MNRHALPEVTVSGRTITVSMPDGREGSMEASQWPRLAGADDSALADFYLSEDGVHWPSLDEDLTYETILRGGERREGLYGLFMRMPWLNVAGLARTLGISQSLMAQYVSGAKKPSRERLEAIEAGLRDLGAQLAALRL